MNRTPDMEAGHRHREQLDRLMSDEAFKIARIRHSMHTGCWRTADPLPKTPWYWEVAATLAVMAVGPVFWGIVMLLGDGSINWGVLVTLSWLSYFVLPILVPVVRLVFGVLWDATRF